MLVPPIITVPAAVAETPDASVPGRSSVKLLNVVVAPRSESRMPSLVTELDI